MWWKDLGYETDFDHFSCAYGSNIATKRKFMLPRLARKSIILSVSVPSFLVGLASYPPSGY